MKQDIENINKLSKLGSEIFENSEILIYSEDVKSHKKLESFTKYCIEHKEQGFWRALLNWSCFHFVKKNTENNNGLGFMSIILFWFWVVCVLNMIIYALLY